MVKKTIEHLYPNAFYRGVRDFYNGKLESPFKQESILEKEWQRGQNSAYFYNLKAIRKRYK